VAILGERVGDAGALRLDELVVERVVEALRRTCQYRKAAESHGSCRTGPVRVLLDFVLHVPTMSAGQVPCADARAARPARPAREYFMLLFLLRLRWWGGAVVWDMVWRVGVGL
jgi:hypothetical protein